MFDSSASDGPPSSAFCCENQPRFVWRRYPRWWHTEDIRWSHTHEVKQYIKDGSWTNWCMLETSELTFISQQVYGVYPSLQMCINNSAAVLFSCALDGTSGCCQWTKVLPILLANLCGIYLFIFNFLEWIKCSHECHPEMNIWIIKNAERHRPLRLMYSLISPPFFVAPRFKWMVNYRRSKIH